VTRFKITGEDCRSCGACCIGGMDDGEGWADCSEEDILRMPERLRARLYGFATPTKMMDAFGKVCAFLRGTPGKRCSCSIYTTRPSVCAQFKPGGVSCRTARAELGLPR